jgi:hypothetical protein
VLGKRSASVTGLIDLKTNWVSPPSAAPCITNLHSYWQRQKGNKGCPSRSDIRPKDLTSFLPHVFLVDVLDEANFRFRLAGSHFCELTNRRMAGDVIEAIFPDMFCAEVRRAWQQASQGATVLGRGQVWIPAKDFLQWEGIVLPLSQSGQDIDTLVGVIEFQPRRAA